MSLSQKALHFSKKIIAWPIKHWKISLMLAVIAIGVGYYFYQKNQSETDNIITENPIYRDLTKTLDVSGVIDAKEKARMRFLAGGKVVYLGAQEGDTVKKGQTLATIDQATLKKQLEQDLNTFMKQRLDWDQLNDDTYVNGLLTKTEDRNLQKEQLDLTSEVLDVEIRSTTIANSRLSAPFTGVLTTSPTAVSGVQLLATDYFEVINPETLIFKGIVDEADISNVVLNQEAKIELDAYEDEVVNSQVSYISYTSNQSSTGTVFLVEFPLPNPDLNKFRIGMNGDVAIILDKKFNVLSVPFEATRERDGKFYVDIKTGKDTSEEREIETGIETEDYIEVISGLSTDDEIIIPE